VGRTLREIGFRDKYRLNVIGIWRSGRAYRSIEHLRDLKLRLGDVLLLYGERDKLRILSRDEDFVLLTEDVGEAPRYERAAVSILIMLAVVVSVMLGWLPISIAAVIGVILMVMMGCLKMEDAYRRIEWRAIFLIAGMLPLGIALENSGAARFIVENIVSQISQYGTIPLVAGIFLITTLATQILPAPVVAVLMAPVVLNMASSEGLSPYALMMVVAVSSSSNFLSPFGHPANTLTMSAGGYRLVDYIRIGLPLVLLELVVVLLVLPVFWSFAPQ